METLDFFTPVVDDPYDFGRVAAANAFSDVYAMGARPIFALNIVAFPLQKLGADSFRRVLEGGQSIADEAGVKMPSFFGYMLYSGAVLIPLFVLVMLLFF